MPAIRGTRVGPRLQEAPRPEHAVLLAVGGDEDEAVAAVGLGGEHLRQVEQHADARTVVVGALHRGGRLVEVGHQHDLLGLARPRARTPRSASARCGCS
jgi:hypothetical protein